MATKKRTPAKKTPSRGVGAPPTTGKRMAKPKAPVRKAPPAKKAKASTAKAPARKAAPAKAKKPAAPKGPVGRPTDYTEALAERICEEVAQNDVSLRQICSRVGMPHRNTVNRWLAKYPDFAAKYVRAREEQGDVVFERMGELEQQVLLGKVEPKAARVVLESRRWRAEKLKPKVYGPRLRLDPGDGAALVVFKDLTGRKVEVEGEGAGA